MKIFNFQFSIFNFRIRNSGAVLLPTILTIGFLMVALGLAGSIIVLALNRSNFSIRLATAGLAAARAGIDDTYLRIIRDNTWPAVDCDVTRSAGDGNKTYDLTLGEIKVYICIKKETFTNEIKYTINSLAQGGFGAKRQLQAVLNANRTTHQVKTHSLNEIEF